MKKKMGKLAFCGLVSLYILQKKLFSKKSEKKNHLALDTVNTKYGRFRPVWTSKG